MEHGFAQSGLRMNIWIAQQSRWTLEEIEERSRQLTKKALEIWSLPETTYCPEKKQYDTYTLGDDVDLSGRDIIRYEYRNTVQPVSSWIAMMEQIMQQLHAEDKSYFTQLAHTDAAEVHVRMEDGIQVVTTTLQPGSYPDLTVQSGIPVRWEIVAPEGSINGCNNRILIQPLGIEYSFHRSQNIIEFTPDTPGTIPYSCWMGMIHGNIFVTDKTPSYQAFN